ncbi:MAG: HNH endonuclease [Clostridia bacterium]
MIIELPSQYERIEGKNNFARVREGVLELKGNYDFEKIMIEMAYLLKGKNRCHYCRNSVPEDKITIDHLYPLDFGGVTITNNLEPACHSCNSKKSNMNQFEFNIWRTINSKEEQKSFYHKTIAKKRARKMNPKKKKGFDLPKKWVTYRNLSAIKKITKAENRKSERFKKMLMFARKYHKLPRPLIISSNYILLDGKIAYSVAKVLHFEEVPVIILENVVVLR